MHRRTRLECSTQLASPSSHEPGALVQGHKVHARSNIFLVAVGQHVTEILGLHRPTRKILRAAILLGRVREPRSGGAVIGRLEHPLIEGWPRVPDTDVRT